MPTWFSPSRRHPTETVVPGGTGGRSFEAQYRGRNTRMEQLGTERYQMMTCWRKDPTLEIYKEFE
ncbi:hypothetical protein Bca52824_044828 [Brassica carinata]|uniref:Uncharacterized protein n=1 Tax=Brassica carinata TaxID=52824 RepID=A0A8X7UNP8_BRACI|nr:hypothetical protein Bca52824_044828 [Brassica carinata]